MNYKWQFLLEGILLRYEAQPYVDEEQFLMDEQVVSPFKPDTPAGRLLSKRGSGGYMIIMQTEDAIARRDYLQSNKLANVIFSHESEESVCIQYHPKGIKGMLLEDSCNV
jgi:hypothetical protein